MSQVHLQPEQSSGQAYTSDREAEYVAGLIQGIACSKPKSHIEEVRQEDLHFEPRLSLEVLSDSLSQNVTSPNQSATTSSHDSGREPEWVQTADLESQFDLEISSGNLFNNSTNRSQCTGSILQEFKCDKTKPENESPNPQLWQPFWLSRKILTFIGGLFCLTGASLLVLRLVDQRKNGIELSLTSNHYAWKFGPTGVLVILATLWRQVEYYNKLLQPWRNMEREPSSPERSLLLDYPSKWQVTGLIECIRHRETPVAISLAGVFIIQLLIALSTTLLNLEETFVSQHGIPVTILSRFDRQRNASFGFETGDGQGIHPDPQFLGNNYMLPVYTVYGLLSSGLQEPVGYIDGIAFHPFTLVSPSHKATLLEVETEAFIPFAECKPIHATILPYERARAINNDYYTWDEVKVSIDFPECGSQYTSPINSSIRDTSPDSIITRNVSHNVRFGISWYTIECSPDNVEPSNLTRVDDVVRWILTISDTSFNKTLDSSSIKYWSREVHDVKVILCSLEYTIVTITITSTTQNANLEWKASTNISKSSSKLVQLPGLSNNQLQSAVAYILSSASGLLTTTFAGPTAPREDSFLLLMELCFSPIATAKELLLNTTAMSEAAEKVFRAVASLFIVYNFVVEEPTRNIGTAVFAQERLRVRKLPLIGMVICSIFIAGLCLALAFNQPVRAMIRSPDTIESLALYLNENDDLSGILEKQGHCTQDEMECILHGILFALTTKRSQKLYISTYEENPTERPLKASAKRPTWIPLSTQYPILFLNLGLSTITIVILEILQMLSNKRNGLVPATTETYVDLFKYGTTIIMLCISGLCGSLHYAILQLTPYSDLRSGALDEARTVCSNLVRRIPLVTFWNSLWNHQIGASVATFGAFLASFLVIVSSGLWSADLSTIRNINFTMERVDTWRTIWSNSTFNDSGAVQTLALIEQGLPFPSSTWDELAFPRFEISPDDLKFLDTTQNNPLTEGQVYNLTLPALRANLECEQIPRSKMRVFQENITGMWNYTYFTENGTAITEVPSTDIIELEIYVPGYCLGELEKDLTSTTIRYTPSPTYTIATDSHGEYIADFTDILIVNQSVTTCIPPRNLTTRRPCDLVDSPAGCPSLAFAFGSPDLHFSSNAFQNESMTIFICHQQLQQLQTTVSFDRISQSSSDPTSLNISSAPHVERSSLTLLTNGTESITSFPFRVSYHLNYGLQGSEVSNTQFFENMLRGANATRTPDDFMGPENAQKLYNAVNHFYRRYMAQVINLNMREPILQVSGDSLPFNVDNQRAFTGATSVWTQRLKIDPIAKLVLQILLGVITACEMIAVLLVDTRNVLPHNPGAIAGTLSLVAGSRWHKAMGNLIANREKRRKQNSEDIVRKFGIGWWKEGTLVRKGWNGKIEEGARFGIDVIEKSISSSKRVSP